MLPDDPTSTNDRPELPVRRRPPRSLTVQLCRAVLAAGAALAAVLLVSVPAGAAGGDRPIRRLTVATFNIHHAAGTDDVLDVDRIARVIATSHADIVGVEELDRHYGDRTNFVDQPAVLAGELGMNYVFAANIDTPSTTPGQPNSQYGTAIFSRYPIVSSTHLLLPRSPDQEQRGLLGAVIDVNGRQVHFYNTHLSASSQVDRQAQADTLRQVIDPSAAPTILTGDLNAEADAPEIKTIATFLDDLWPLAGRGDGFTFDSDDPRGRIDFIFGSPGTVMPRLVRVGHFEPAASDHLLVSAIVTIP